MSVDNSNIKIIQSHLQGLTGIEAVSKVKIKDNIIEEIIIQTKSMGNLTIKSVGIKDSLQLFNFYFHGLSEKARIFFCPYPIFNPRPKTSNELSNTIKNWQKEDDWTMLKLSKGAQIIGICLLKRYKTERPTSGLAIHEKFQKKGLGILLQTIINEQAYLLHLKKLVITLAQNNKASFKVHKKAGFKKTNKLIPHFIYVNGIKKKDRLDIEMIKRFDY